VTAVPITDTAYGHIATNDSVITEERLIGADTEEIVRSYFSDIPIMIQIARCESAFRQTRDDGTVLRGTVDSADVGVMQINERYHKTTAEKMGYNLNDIYGNMAYARALYEKQGTRPWNASSACWSPTIAMR
jgi:hypothetical protein